MKIGDQEWVFVPVKAAEEQWSGVARDLMMWIDASGGRPTGKTLRFHFKHAVGPIPAWLETEIPDEDHVPSKGTRCQVIYEAMLSAAPGADIEAMVEGVAIALEGCDSDAVGWLNTSESYKNTLRYRARAVLRHLFGEG